jgi:hypothetical protein
VEGNSDAESRTEGEDTVSFGEATGEGWSGRGRSSCSVEFEAIERSCQCRYRRELRLIKYEKLKEHAPRTRKAVEYHEG